MEGAIARKPIYKLRRSLRLLVAFPPYACWITEKPKLLRDGRCGEVLLPVSQREASYWEQVPYVRRMRS